MIYMIRKIGTSLYLSDRHTWDHQYWGIPYYAFNSAKEQIVKLLETAEVVTFEHLHKFEYCEITREQP